MRSARVVCLVTAVVLALRTQNDAGRFPDQPSAEPRETRASQQPCSGRRGVFVMDVGLVSGS